MADQFEAKCPGCGSAVFHDKHTWCKCDICGERVYFHEKYRKQFGNPMSPKFQKDSWDEDSVSDDDEEEGTTDSSLEDFI